MFQIENEFMKNTLIIHLKRYKLALAYSFMIGLFLGSIPFIYKSKENFRAQELIQEQQKIELQAKEEICKDKNSDYTKFMSLGFPKTAIEKLYYCMKEQ